MTWPTTNELRDELDKIRQLSAKQLDALCNFERNFAHLIKHCDDEMKRFDEMESRLDRLEVYVRPKAA